MAVQAGLYRVDLTVFSGPNSGQDYAQCNLSWQERVLETPIYKKNGGGLRIKNISTYESNSSTIPIVKNYDYTMDENGRTISSGVSVGEPKYEQYLQKLTFVDINTSCTYYSFLCNYTRTLGSSSIVFGTTGGGLIGYRKVSVFLNNNGKTVKEYTSPKDYPSVVNYIAPFSDPESNDYKTGLITKESVFDQNGNILQTASFDYFFQEQNIYSPKVTFNIPLPGGATIYPVSVSSHGATSRWNTWVSYPPKQRFGLWWGQARMGYAQLKRKTTFSDGLTTVTDYTYDQALQLKKSEVIQNSDNKTYSTNYYYATDLNDQNLISKFMVAMPLKVENVVNGTITKSALSSYALFNSNQVFLQQYQ